jgi:SAM-dependent methyltransferase
VCVVCGSFWDVESRSASVQYDASYPEHRGHFDPQVGELKVKSLMHWIERAGVSLAGKHVLEVGFGGGTCLPYLTANARKVSGIEANASAIERVRQTGTTADLLQVGALPERLSEPVDLWLFQDSFEHIPDPAPFMRWVVDNSAPRAEMLMVLPRADSRSQRLLGRFWPHKLPDHEFHWSQPGLVEFMAKRGFTLDRTFFPIKFASPQMVIAHLVHKLGGSDRLRGLLSGTGLAFPLNFGEMGLRLVRSAV